MSNRNPTNTDLANKLDALTLKVEKVEDKMQVFHDFMIVQKAIGSRKANGTIDWQRLIEKGLILLTVAFSIVYMLVEFVIKRAS